MISKQCFITVFVISTFLCQNALALRMPTPDDFKKLGEIVESFRHASPTHPKSQPIAPQKNAIPFGMRQVKLDHGPVTAIIPATWQKRATNSQNSVAVYAPKHDITSFLIITKTEHLQGSLPQLFETLYPNKNITKLFSKNTLTIQNNPTLIFDMIYKKNNTMPIRLLGAIQQITPKAVVTMVYKTLKTNLPNFTRQQYIASITSIRTTTQ